MTKVSFSDIFSGEYLIVINKYRERIQSILANYDVAIFMARKAICFYQAMVTNNEVLSTKCLVVSSRVLDYNFIKKYEKKRIAIIDDVVVKGDSLRKVASILSKCNIEADTYVVACEQTFGNNFNSQFSGCKLKETYTCLTTKAIYSFSAMITEYIEASMCPFNIDQPIYKGIKDEELKSFFTNVDAFDLSSGVQVKYGIQSKVLYFTLNVNLADKQIQEIINKSILKIRFLSSGIKTKVIPFVLFQELNEDQLNRLFSYIETVQILSLISNNNINIVRENKLKIINYFYSELLLIIFSKKFDFKFCKDNSNDIIQFGEKTSSLYENELKKVYLDCFKNCKMLDIADFDFSKFHFSESIANIYRAIDNIDVDAQTYTNAEGKKLSDSKEKIITNDYLESFIETQLPSKRYIVSSVIDILIDKGMIVPAIVHSQNNGIIRAYKLGEYSKLTREQFREFVCMLNLYQDLIKDDIDRTEFEKLCVIYFTTAIHQNHFKQQTNYEEDCYSISYSLYGPRVSAGKVSYKVNSLSALATKLLSEEERMMFESKDKKYVMNSIFKDNKNNKFLTMFSYRFAALRKLFEDPDGWDKNAYTYIQYLTLKAIGESNKSKFLSLCAELYQIVQISDDIFNIEEFDRNRHGLILSGINSGLWKYQCFKQDVLEKTFHNIVNKDIKLAMSFGDDFNEENDKSKIWETIIDLCGEVLYSAAYLLNETIIKYSLYSSFDIKNADNSESNKTKNAKLIFTSRDYYNTKFNLIRLKYENLIANNAGKNIQAYVENEIIMLKKKAQYILDLADLYLESNNPNYTKTSKILVVYSKKSTLPKNLCADLQSIRIMGLDNKFSKSYRCYILDNDLSGIPVLVDILNKTYSKQNLHFIVMNMSEWYEGFVHVGENVRGHFAVNILNKILKHIDNTPTNIASNMLTVVGKGFDKTFESEEFTFMRKENSDIELNSEYVAEEYNIYKKTLNNKASISIGIICALDEELKAVLSRIEETFGIKRNIKIDKTWNNREYYHFVFTYNKKHIQLYVLEQRRQGNTSSSAAYSFLVRYSLDFIVFCGIAGSLSKKIKIGDVLIPTEILDVTLKKEVEEEYISRGTVHSVSSKLVGFINLFIQNVSIKDIMIHRDPVVSDNTVIACEDSDIIKKVLSYNNKVAGVEMESAGIYEADYEAGQTEYGTMTIRGISDNADHIKNDEYHKLASNNAAKVLCKFIKHYVDMMSRM